MYFVGAYGGKNHIPKIWKIFFLKTFGNNTIFCTNPVVVKLGLL